MKVEEKLEELGYLIFTTCEDNVMIGCKCLNVVYNIHIIIRDDKVVDYNIKVDSFIRHQSDIDRIQTAYSVLQSDLKELKNEYKNIW